MHELRLRVPRRSSLFLLLAIATLLTSACGFVTDVNGPCAAPPATNVTFDVRFDVINPGATSPPGTVVIVVDVPDGFTFVSATYDTTADGGSTATPIAPGTDPLCAGASPGPVEPGYQRFIFTQTFTTYASGDNGTLHATFNTGTETPAVYYPRFFAASADGTATANCPTDGSSTVVRRFVIGTATDVDFDVTSLFNADVIVNNGSGTIDPTQTSVTDPASEVRALPTQSVAVSFAPPTPDGLPDDGVLTAECSPVVNLAYSNSDDGNNVRQSINAPDTFTIIVPPNRYDEVHLIGNSSNSSPGIPVDVTLNYSDGTSTTTTATFDEITLALPPPGFPDITLTGSRNWFAARGRDSISPTADPITTTFQYFDDNSRNVYGIPVDTDATRTLTSITVVRTSVTGVLNFFGATGVIIDAADISITKVRSSAGALTVGSVQTYTLTLGNSGPAAATGVVVTDVLPAGLQFVSASASQGSCSNAAGTVTCNVGTVGVGAAPTVTIQAQVAAAGAISNTATVTTTSPELDTTDNSSTLVETAGLAADLSVTKTVLGSASVAAGANVTFRIAVTNAGPSPSAGTTLTDALPAGVTFVSATPTQGTCSQAAGTVTCTLGSIAAGATATVDVIVTATGSGTITNTAQISDAADGNPSNNSESEAITVTAADPTEIPTLSFWVLMMLGAMLAVAAVQRLT